MAEQTSKRKLAAILSADVAGNSGLMGNDEPNRIWFAIDRAPVVSLSISKPMGVSLFLTKRTLG